MLACAPSGLSEHFLLARGFSAEMLSNLVLAKLAIVEIDAALMVERIRITDAGRMSLERLGRHCQTARHRP
jgi:hypothetical protein